MKKFHLLCFFIAASGSAFAQENPTGYSKASAAYHDYRLQETEPTYSLARVKSLVKHIKNDKDDNPVLAAKTYNALSTKEKFTYCMLNGEVFSQNCNGMPGVLDEEKKIFAHPPGPWFEQYDWSKRQESFLRTHRGTVIGLLRDTMRARGRVGTNMKKAILLLEAKELIPDMVTVYRKTNRDQDILSTFCVLMKDGDYKPFTGSETYRKLYGDPNASYQTFIMANPENRALTIKRAMAFTKSQSG